MTVARPSDGSGWRSHEAALLQTVDDSGDGAVRKAHATAQFFEAEATGVKKRLHHSSLRAQ